MARGLLLKNRLHEALPRGEPERAGRTISANREHRLARAGTADVALDPGGRRVVDNPRSASLLGSNGQKRAPQPALRGVASEWAVYEFPETPRVGRPAREQPIHQKERYPTRRRTAARDPETHDSGADGLAGS